MSPQPPLSAHIAPVHRFEEERLARYLRANIDEFGEDMVVRQFQGGASNPTFLLVTNTARGSARYVLRKQPPGSLLPSAHQVDREFRIMDALKASDIPVPVMRHLCEDPEVIGAKFYVMDFVEGRVFRDARLPGLTPAERGAIYDELNATLAKLHLVDYAAMGLADFGRATGYFERQVSRWTKQYRAAETGNLPAMEQLIARLPGRIPANEEATIAHGDYRLENALFHPTEPKLLAILDWELATIGHPLADLAYNAFLWRSDNATWGALDGIDLRASGIPTEAEYVAAYCRRTGRAEIRDWTFYMAFAVFRLASIAQGVHRRTQSGTVASERDPINRAPELAQTALDLLEAKPD